jgi:hypothetical protein
LVLHPVVGGGGRPRGLGVQLVGVGLVFKREAAGLAELEQLVERVPLRGLKLGVRLNLLGLNARQIRGLNVAVLVYRLLKQCLGLGL